MMRPLAVLIALGTSAWASSWSSFEPAFPAHPCHDGWAGCVVDGRAVSPDMVTDGVVPRPADLRVDFMSLEATASFSPFAALSEYTGSAPDVAAADAEPEDDGVAEVEAAPPPRSKETVEAERQADEAAAVEAAARASEEEARRQAEEAERARREAEAASAKAVAEEEQRRKEADRLAAAAASAQAEEQARLAAEAETARKAAEEAEKARLAAEKAEQERREAEERARAQAAAEEKARQEAAAAAAAAEAEAKRQAEIERQRVEEERQAREAAEAAKKAEADRVAAEAAAKAAAEGDTDAAAAAAAPAAVDDGSCDDLTALEPPAMLGKLSDGQIGCLETKLADSFKMTDKKKISLLLMSNAFSKGDRKSWETLAKRHLDEIDQSDPDLCYKYALHLGAKGPGRASGVIRWANVALENRTVWTGDVYKTRVYSLYKLRSAASQMLWQAAEQEHAASPSEATQSKIEKYRNMTKVNAREWYEYAKVSGKDPTKALQLCMSAAGTADYCEAG